MILLRNWNRYFSDWMCGPLGYKHLAEVARQLLAADLQPQASEGGLESDPHSSRQPLRQASRPGATPRRGPRAGSPAPAPDRWLPYNQAIPCFAWPLGYRAPHASARRNSFRASRKRPHANNVDARTALNSGSFGLTANARPMTAGDAA